VCTVQCKNNGFHRFLAFYMYSTISGPWHMGVFRIIVESARDVPYGDINLQELILQAHTSVVFKGRRAGGNGQTGQEHISKDEPRRSDICDERSTIYCYQQR
jgi:hypothetical protein